MPRLTNITYDLFKPRCLRNGNWELGKSVCKAKNLSSIANELHRSGVSSSSILIESRQKRPNEIWNHETVFLNVSTHTDNSVVTFTFSGQVQFWFSHRKAEYRLSRCYEAWALSHVLVSLMNRACFFQLCCFYVFLKDPLFKIYEPPHDKTNKMNVRPAWTQIRVFAVRMKKCWALNYLVSAQWRLWSDWAAQADLSFCWAHISFCWFCRVAAQLS